MDNNNNNNKMLRTEKWGRKVRMTIWLKKNRTKYFHRSWNCFRVDESWWKLAQKRQHYFNSAQWSIRNIQFFINSENLSKSGADLGIFVCQSKMTSHFCNDRFHFIFRGGWVLGDAPPQNFLKRSCILRALWSKILKY